MIRIKDIRAALDNAESNLRLGTNDMNLDFACEALRFSSIAIGCIASYNLEEDYAEGLTAILTREAGSIQSLSINLIKTIAAR